MISVNQYVPCILVHMWPRNCKAEVGYPNTGVWNCQAKQVQFPWEEQWMVCKHPAGENWAGKNSTVDCEHAAWMDRFTHAPAACLVAQAGTIVVHQYTARRKLKCPYNIIMYIYVVYMCLIYFLPRLKINHMTGREIIFRRQEEKYTFVLEHGAVANSSSSFVN